jgi:hypothetical protein
MRQASMALMQLVPTEPVELQKGRDRGRDAITYACDGSAAASPLTARSFRAATPNRVGLFTRSASAHFAWAMIVASP